MCPNAVSTIIASQPLLPELLDQIASYLNPKDVANARLSSIDLCHAFTPYLVPLLWLNLSSKVEQIGRTTYKPRSFVPTPESLIKSIKALRIDFLHSHLRAAGQSKQEEIVNICRNEIARFVSLQRLATNWRVGRLSALQCPLGDMETTLLEAIPNPARLQQLKVESFLFVRAPPALLRRFANLRSLEVARMTQTDNGKSAIVEQIHTLLADTTTLTRLWLPSIDSSTKLLLHDIFPSPLIRPQLPLRSLNFSGNCAWLPTAKFQSTGLPYLPDLRQLILKAGRADENSDWDAFWDLLRQTGTGLHDLLVDEVLTLSLMEYLASFKGLQQLILSQTPLIPIPFNITEPLITRVFTQHAPSLQRLVVYLPCIGIHTDPASEGHSFVTSWPSPTCFSNLKYLCTWSPRAWTFNLENCQALHNWLRQFPSLEGCITVFPSLWQGASQVGSDGPDFHTIGRALTEVTGRPREWTLFYDVDHKPEECTWRAEQRDDGIWNYTRVQEGYDDVAWLEGLWS